MSNWGVVTEAGLTCAPYESLSTDAVGDESDEKHTRLRTSRPWGLVPILFAIICFQSVALVAALYWRPLTATPRLYSPAQHLVEETVKVYPLGFGADLSPFQVPSSPALDQAWEDLYSFGISRIPKSAAAQLPNKTSPIPGDPGFYIAELDVFHELHCLNMVRMALDPDYYPEWNIKTNERSREHVSHCVDWIRHAIMCHSDTSVIVWQWNSRYNQSTPKARIPHTCRNFEPIREWGMQNAMLVDYNDTIHIEDDLPVPPYVF
ncbi:hypothetical protein C8F04DRAFT_66154 [Mycena alexandri]|uniref:Tat pathway signal sequence n=1 Tax=Mycena alexandri TaxID=1745969 RepID=A0AAD6SK41_9AGAR|nr:hypothetical protein C8F04DRAFT_66154 [Mycena alexandri]